MPSLEINNADEALQIAKFIRDTDMRMRLMQTPSSSPFDFHFGGDTLTHFKREVMLGIEVVNAVLGLSDMPKIFYGESRILRIQPSQHPDSYLDIITPTIRPDVLVAINYDPSAQFSVLELINNEPRFQPLV